jgi:hypothetical protein
MARVRGDEAVNEAARPRRPLPEPSPEKLNRLYELIEDIEVAMLTTRRRDGSLVSRPMATQRRADAHSGSWHRAIPPECS